jgi:hypothetical protein
MSTPLFNVRLDPVRRAELEAAAQDHGLTRSDVVRAALDHFRAVGMPGLGHRPQLPLEENAA